MERLGMAFFARHRNDAKAKRVPNTLLQVPQALAKIGRILALPQLCQNGRIAVITRAKLALSDCLRTPGVVAGRPVVENRFGTLSLLLPGNRELFVTDPATDPAVEFPDDSLAAALERHHTELPPEQVAELEQYCRALWSWNQKLNLTRHTDYEKFVTRDMADSLALEQFLDAGERVLDVGTGGGVPGIVLAIVRPDLEVSLCDSMSKKAKAVEAIVAETGLKIPVYHAPVQQVLAERQFNTLVARAVAPLSKLLRWVAPHWESFDRVLIIKGPAWVEERSEAREAGLLRKVELRKIAEYPLPGTESQSVVLSLRPKEI